MATPLRVPLKKKEHSARKHVRDFIQGVGGDPMGLDFHASGKGHVALFNSHNTEYYGPVSFGTPEKTVTAIFDTGSAVTWVTSSSCDAADCGAHTGYNRSESATWSRVTGTGSDNVDLRYGTGEVLGDFERDTVVMGGVSVPGVAFLAVNKMDATVRRDAADALVGLAWPSISKSIDAQRVPPVFFDMVAADLLEAPVFSFYLSRVPDVQDLSLPPPPTSRDAGRRTGSAGSLGAAKESELLFGGYDASHLRSGEELHEVPLARTDYWSIFVDTVYVGDENLNTCGDDDGGGGGGATKLPCYGIVDSGTSFIVVPPVVFAAIFNKISAIDGVECDAKRAESSGELWCTPCTADLAEFPQLTFAVDGVAYGLSPADYVQKFEQGKATGCLFELLRFSLGSVYDNSFILGDTFLRRYYSVYNTEKATVSLGTAVGAPPLNLTIHPDKKNHGNDQDDATSVLIIVAAVLACFAVLALLGAAAVTFRRSAARRLAVGNREMSQGILPNAGGLEARGGGGGANYLPLTANT